MSDAFSDWYEAKLAESRFAEEWTPCVKLPITVHFRKQRPGEKHVSTREGITPLNSDDLIMRGVAGEEYPIGRELFERTYRIGTAQPDSAARIAALEREVEALRADAERWRYVVTHAGWYRRDDGQVRHSQMCVRLPYEADQSCVATRTAAIDAARSKE